MGAINKLDTKKMALISKWPGTVIDRLRDFDWKKDNPELLVVLKLQKEIQKDILKAIKGWPQPDNPQYHDWEHRLRWRMDMYFMSCSSLVNCMEEGKWSNETKESILMLINKTKPELIDIIESLNDISVDMKEKSLIQDLIPYIELKFQKGEIDIENNIHILCSKRVFKWIIDELKENYRKYGTEWYISVSKQNNMVVVSLKNKKKEKNENDFSSRNWLKIFDEYMKALWGEFTYDYNTEDCVTTISFPIAIESN